MALYDIGINSGMTGLPIFDILKLLLIGMQPGSLETSDGLGIYTGVIVLDPAY